MSQSKSDDKPDRQARTESDPAFNSFLETLSGKLKHRVTQMKDAKTVAGIKQKQPKPNDANSFAKKMVN
jgi:hypothetical protein